MAISSAAEVFQLMPHGVGKFSVESLRGLLRIKYFRGQTLPALGMVLLAADDTFTPTSHTYTATMTPRKTADTPSPAAIFTDRTAVFLNREFDNSPVVAVEWAVDGSDFPTTGRYDLRFTATEVGTGNKQPFPLIEIEVVEPV